MMTYIRTYVTTNMPNDIIHNLEDTTGIWGSTSSPLYTLRLLPSKILFMQIHIILVGECSAFLASGSDPTDERCMKHGPQTTPRRGRRELAACALTERVIASRVLTFHRVKHRECAHAFFSCNAYLETLRYVPESARPDRYEICYAVSQPLTLI